MPAEELTARLAAVVRAATGDTTAEVTGLIRMSGGASRETWSFDARHDDGTIEPLILRRDPPGSIGLAASQMALEARALAAAAGAGVPVPRILASGDDDAALESPYIVMERIDGETIPRRILREEAYAGARQVLAAQCGQVLARIHRVDPDAVGGLDRTDPLGRFREALDVLGEPHPAFELGLRWLDANRPPPGPAGVVHGDFRNGNLIVGPEGIRAVLDWELVHAGDPLEDLGWLCVRAWRFGVDRPVGGFGDYDDLIGAYEEESGTRVDRAALRWWEVLGTLKWGVICIMQAARHASGAVRSVELAAIGRRVCENEWDLLNLLPQPWAGAAADEGAGAVAAGAGSGVAAHVDAVDGDVVDGGSTGGGGGRPPHDAPDAVALLEAVREFLQADVLEATSGRVQYHTRVAANVVAMVERELTLGPAQAARHAEGLRRLGFSDPADLAAAIRDGRVDTRLPEVAAFVRATVVDKLEVANPRHGGAGGVTFPVL